MMEILHTRLVCPKGIAQNYLQEVEVQENPFDSPTILEYRKIEGLMEKKISKTERIAMITKELIEHPSKLYTLQYFSDMLNCAKSTLSEDIKSIEASFERYQSGRISSIAGAAGGVFYIPLIGKEEIEAIKRDLCDQLSRPERIIPGGYMYMNDVLYDTSWLRRIACAIISSYDVSEIDYVVTIETKGIPLATFIANMLNIPIVVIRKQARLTEGTTIQMNYVTGSKKTIKTMALPIKSIARGSKVLFVDDFMKAGGTAKGVIDLMKEFDTRVVGTAMMMSQQTSECKLINDYFALVELVGIDEGAEEILIKPL